MTSPRRCSSDTATRTAPVTLTAYCALCLVEPVLCTRFGGAGLLDSHATGVDFRTLSGEHVDVTTIRGPVDLERKLDRVCRHYNTVRLHRLRHPRRRTRTTRWGLPSSPPRRASPRTRCPYRLSSKRPRRQLVTAAMPCLGISFRSCLRNADTLRSVCAEDVHHAVDRDTWRTLLARHRFRRGLADEKGG